jgi:formamidopyrimidine-DNA glycosylase
MVDGAVELSLTCPASISPAPAKIRSVTIHNVPELPEVERAVRQLRPAMEGARFDRVVVHRRRLRTLLPAHFEARLERAAVKSLRRRGKYLVADLSTGGTLVMHLGMSGSFDVHLEGPAALTKHDHVVFHMSSGATVIFNDPRRFGSMWLYDDSVAANPTSALGPEPLDEEFGADVLAGTLRGRRAPLKAALSDQRVVAGLGNIYVSEALHRARLSPRRASGTLVTASGAPRPPLRALVRAIRDTLHDALSDRREGEDRFRVYDREGQRCLRRGCPGRIKRIVQAGRSTFFCPSCQR